MKALLIALLMLIGSIIAITAQPPVMGADQIHSILPELKGKRVGLIVNHTSVTSKEHVHLLDTIKALGVNVVAAFAPEHGFRGNEDAGASISHDKDPKTGTPIISLYGKNYKPTKEQMDKLDVVVFDIQDVGARFYTYISTMYYAMEACAENGKKMIILDRPNPADYIDGPILDTAFRSFVGIVPIPILHGMTIGELAMMINGEQWLRSKKRECNLFVVAMKGWKHGQPYSLPIKPSPNLPNDKSIQLYTSLCLFEATIISLGRGTTYPFQTLGAPDKKFGSFAFTPRSLAGFDTNPMHKDKTCYGVDLRNVDFNGGFTLKYIIEFAKKVGGIEKLVDRKQVFNRLAGNDVLYRQLATGMDEESIRKSWQPALNDYKTKRAKYVLYDDQQ